MSSLRGILQSYFAYYERSRTHLVGSRNVLHPLAIAETSLEVPHHLRIATPRFRLVWRVRGHMGEEQVASFSDAVALRLLNTGSRRFRLRCRRMCDSMSI